MVYLKEIPKQTKQFHIKKVVVTAVGELRIDTKEMDYALGGSVVSGEFGTCYKINYCEDLDLFYRLMFYGFITN